MMKRSFWPMLPFAAAVAFMLAAPALRAEDGEKPRRGKKVSGINYARQEDLAAVKALVEQLALGQAALKEQMNVLSKSLAAGQGVPEAEAQARLMAKLDEALQEILILSEKLSDANYRLAMGARNAPPAALTPPPASGEPINPVSGGGVPPVRPDSALEGDPAYQAAYADYTRGNYALAVMGFEEFMRQNPAHDLADNALYWIGECHYAERAFDKAIAAFERLQKEFPQSDKAAAALLKQGYAYIESYQMAQGIVRLQGLIEKYPHSSEAKLAKQKLKEMGI